MMNVMTAARDLKIARVVHTSTSEVYGTAEYVPIDENHPLAGRTPYAASKIAADQLAESFHHAYDVPVTTARPFNTFGPRQSTRAVIPAIIAQAITGERILLGATHPTRDLTFVKDMVQGLLQVADCADVVGQVTNLGSGIEVTIRDLVDRIVDLVGRDVEVVFDATRLKPGQSEVDRLLADNTKAREIVGWEPQLDLDEGLRRTIDWISERVSLFRPREFVF
jgi:nucleoside-diphosphate-sugar epimerase